MHLTKMRLGRMIPNKMGQNKMHLSVRRLQLMTWFWLLVIPFSMIAVGLVQQPSVQTALPLTLFRIVTMWYVLVIPGMTLVKLLQLRQAHIEWMLAVVVSICVNMLMTELMIYLHAYFPKVVLALVLIINLIAWLALVWFTFRRGRHDDTAE